MKDVLSKPFSAVQRRSRALLAGIPVDLFAIAGFVVMATVLLAIVGVSSSLVRAAIGLPLLFLAPGYAVVSTLFPRRTSATTPETGSTGIIPQTQALSDVERVALSFGLSFALLPLLGLAIAPVGFTTETVVGTVGGVTLTLLGIATGRRLTVPAQQRYRVNLGQRIAAARRSIVDGESTAHTAINVALVLSMVVALTTVGYALVAPQQGEEYTSLELLTENDAGELVASGYPSAVEPGESIPLVIGVENNEGQDMNYTVVVQEQRIEDGEVVDRTELRQIQYSLSEDGVGYGDRDITPTGEPGTVRISVLVYTDEVPETPTYDNAYRYAYFWTEITTEDPGDETEAIEE